MDGDHLTDGSVTAGAQRPAAGDNQPRAAAQRSSNWVPDFFVIGPPRTGTTWLHNAMNDHVNLPRTVKETRFFDLRYSKGIAWYRARFGSIAPGLPIGEMGPTYFYSADARKRISRFAPRAKIICTLRDPVEQLYSLYTIRYAAGVFDCSFPQALETDDELRECIRLSFHLNEWLKTFSREQALVLRYEQLEEDIDSYVAEVCRFIGIAPIACDPSLRTRKNSSKNLWSPTRGRLSLLAGKTATSLKTNGYTRTTATIKKFRLRKLFFAEVPLGHSPLDPDFAEELRTRMLPELNALEELLQQDFSSWKPRVAQKSG